MTKPHLRKLEGIWCFDVDMPSGKGMGRPHIRMQNGSWVCNWEGATFISVGTGDTQHGAYCEMRKSRGAFLEQLL
jgi:hypothetical protein